MPAVRTTLHLPEMRSRPGPRLRLGFALLGAPAAWIVHLCAQLALVGTACRVGSDWPLHLATAATLPVALLGTWTATRVRRDPARAGAVGEAVEPTRTLGWVGVVLGVIFSSAIVLEAVLVLALDPCGAP